MKKKIIGLLLAFSLVLGVSSCSSKDAKPSVESNNKSVESTEQTTGEGKDIQILATSDLHGVFVPYNYALDAEVETGSFAQVSTAIKELKDDNTILIDNGDTIQSNSAELFIDDETHPMIACLNALDYDVWVTGNHEFNYGMDNLERIAKQFKGDFLCGNVFDKDGKTIGKPYTIIEKNGVKVGVIGMVTQNITRWDAENLKDYEVKDAVEETKAAIKELEGKVDVIVASEHMGESNEYDVPNSGVVDLANACPEIDVIVAGHEHKAVPGEEVNGVLIVENKSEAQTLTQINITVEKDKDGKYQVVDKVSDNIETAEYAVDPDIVTLTADADKKAKDDAQQVIGKLVGGPLAEANEITDVPRAQLEETPLIDFINEVQLHYADAEVSAAALFVSNANLQDGDIRKCDTALVYKFANTLYKLEMTGKQLKQYMEWSANFYQTFEDGDLTIAFDPEIRDYNYDMFSGVKYDINISKEPGSRIENLTHMDGTPVEDDDDIILAVNNYRANSQLLTPGTVYAEGEDLPKLLEMDVDANIGGVRELIGDYIKNVKGGTLEAPELTGNWKVTGYSWDEDLHKKAVEEINAGTLKVSNPEDRTGVNIYKITEKDLK